MSESSACLSVMMQFDIKVAGLVFHVSGWRGLMFTQRFADYLCEPSPEAIPIVLTDETLAYEKAMGEADGVVWSDEAYEFISVMRLAARAVLPRGRMFLHAASIAYRGRGYMFTAHSGTGKSTHIGLWRKYLGEAVQMVNGDRPILTFGEEITVGGAPWAGKECYQRNWTVPLDAIVLLKRGTRNQMRRVGIDEAMEFLYGQCFLITEPACAGYILEKLDRLLGEIPVYELMCNMEEDAVRCSFETLTGLNYETEKMK